MKKIFSIAMICSVLTLVSVSSAIAKEARKNSNDTQKVEIVKPDKTKVNKKQEKRKNEDNAKIKKNLHKKLRACMKQNFLL